MAFAPTASPQIGQDDMQNFFNAHFSETAIDSFASRFLKRELAKDKDAYHVGCSASVFEANEEQWYDDEEYYEEEEDDLGYYADGVKRTLTDEQIAMFRHSELEAIRRAKEKGQNPSVDSPSVLIQAAPTAQEGTPMAVGDDDLSDGEIAAEPPATGGSGKTKKKKKKRRPNKNRNPGEQIDLRKRTWDVVETGLDTLGYDDDDVASSANKPAQRRRISYEDN